jgi:hypothetical protein
LVALAAAGCAPAPKPVSAAAADSARSAYEKVRASAYAPRRFKALFQGEVAPKIGAIARGYLSCWWDGRVLVWRASAPLAGAGDSGRLSLDEPSRGRVPFPGELDAKDAIGLLFGVLDLPPLRVEASSGGTRVVLDERGRAAVLDGDGRIVEIDLPGGARGRFEPGGALPRSIDAKSKDGSAKLTLQSYGDWPQSEPLP